MRNLAGMRRWFVVKCVRKRTGGCGSPGTTCLIAAVRPARIASTAGGVRTAGGEPMHVLGTEIVKLLPHARADLHRHCGGRDVAARARLLRKRAWNRCSVQLPVSRTLGSPGRRRGQSAALCRSSFPACSHLSDKLPWLNAFRLACIARRLCSWVIDRDQTRNSMI